MKAIFHSGDVKKQRFMNYQKIYDNLIDRARNRTLQMGTYVERHHVVPKCLGGSNMQENLVDLTPEEHYLAHQLLVKLNPGNSDLICAATFMSVDRKGHKVNLRLYGWLKRKLSLAKTGLKHTEESKRKMSKAKMGKKRGPLSEETRKKMSDSAKNCKYTLEARSENLKKHNATKVVSAETRAKISKIHKGKTMSEESRRKISETLKARKNKKVENVI